jgi:fumarate reductase flavoprotein subunit
MDKANSETDVVVIGSGVAGLSAALTAAEGGATVILFEKQRALGGASNFLEGTFAVESEMQRKRFIDYTRDEAFKNIMEYSHWRANARLVRAFVDKSADTIGWLQKQGVEFIDATTNMPGAPRTYHVIKGYGEALVKTLAIRAREEGVNIRPETPVKKILREGEQITGVIAEGQDEDIQVASKVVFIGSGGYANNKEWIKKYTGFNLGVNVIPIGNVGKMGDGIHMAWDIGAAEEGMGVLELLRIGPRIPEFPMKNAVELAAAQPDLWVDPHGERFCDETVTFYDTAMGNANARFKEGYTYSLFDESIKQNMLDRGAEKYLGWDNLPGTRPVGIDKMINDALERGTTEIFVADSIEELAKKIGVNPVVLKATVDEYNGFCEKGHDDLFAKDPRYLLPLKGPKFYAMKAYTICIGTIGGIKINQKAEVVDKKGKVIPGLYAGGFDAGGAYGDSYSIRDSSGMSSAFAINCGRIAGQNALKYLGKD